LLELSDQSSSNYLATKRSPTIGGATADALPH
jgi:hypothetical protein